MTAPKPHYLLFCDGNTPASSDSAASQRGRWRFVLEDVESGVRTEATDQEQSCAPDRCALVSVLRGLESLEQPSRVTLITTSRYVTRGLQYGLTEWRENDFTWEHFGAVQPIRNSDIWRRIDRTLAFHQVQCRWMAQEDATDEEAMNVIDEHEGNAPKKIALQNRPVTEPGTSLPQRSYSAQNNVRTRVANSNNQRIYVDTPNTAKNNVTAKIYAEIPSASRAILEIDRESDIRKPNRVLQSFRTFFYRLTWPIRLAVRCQVSLCKGTWNVILAVDEWLESYLRCLLLLDPKKRSSRH
jgi:ribonuclease HI